MTALYLAYHKDYSNARCLFEGKPTMKDLEVATGWVCYPEDWEIVKVKPRKTAATKRRERQAELRWSGSSKTSKQLYGAGY